MMLCFALKLHRHYATSRNSSKYAYLILVVLLGHEFSENYLVVSVLSVFLPEAILNFLLKRSTRPPESTIFCLPV